MSVRKDESGRRWVQAEVEVPGTPEEVWAAIATAEGVSSWFVPTEKREDGTIISHFGPGMDAVAQETAWEPPRRFAAEGELGPGAPKISTEWVVEAKAGGTCVVQVVHSLFATGDAARYLSEPPLTFPPPHATIVKPGNGSTLRGRQLLDVIVSDSFDVTKVEYLLSGEGRQATPLSGGAKSNYGWIGAWNTSTVPNGTYTIDATSTDSDGRSVTTSPVEVRVEN